MGATAASAAMAVTALPWFTVDPMTPLLAACIAAGSCSWPPLSPDLGGSRLASSA
ncbi:hypothetical protein P9139_09805 [Curtobacterium flaccumfaciens]|nr:hypothetical protein P9139_09805 [Curtobacterium flaccumfaciens]